MEFEIRSRFSPAKRVGLNTGPGITQQVHKREADINVLMQKYEKFGVLPQHVRVDRYGDFTDVEDFLGAQLRVKDAESQFMALPARVRERFKNSTALFLQFVTDKNNLEEARKLGLLKEEVAVAKAEPIPGAEVVTVK